MHAGRKHADPGQAGRGQDVEDKLAEDKLAEDKMVEDKQCKRKLQKMEADSPAVNVVAYMYIVAGWTCKKLWIRMDPLRGVFGTLEVLL